MDGVKFEMSLAGKRSLEVDVDYYQGLFDDPSLSDAQKREMLEALWGFITAFVDLGYGVHPVQQVCGESAVDSTPDEADAVRSTQLTNTKISKNSADDDPPRER